jgi:hypothetical protein
MKKEPFKTLLIQDVSIEYNAKAAPHTIKKLPLCPPLLRHVTPLIVKRGGLLDLFYFA